MISKVIKWVIVVILLLCVGLVGFFYNAYQEVELDADKIINYRPNVSSEILDRNGNLLAYIFKGRHRLYATFDEIPSSVIEALVATEDTSFFEHKGINPDAIIRAIIVDIKARRFVEGGSTLTQQLVKNKLLSSKKKLTRKIREAILAVKIENLLSKEEIIERYLNEIPYGNNYYGIKTAAQGYFHKELSNLTLKESAILVGLPNAPTYYNPRRHYKRILNRANAILYRMKNLGWIDNEQYQKAIKETPRIYRTSLTQNVAPYVVDEVLRRFKNRFGDIRTGGYKIYTTIDLNLQKAGREALKYGYNRALERFKKGRGVSQLNGSLVSVESKSGDILALVGGVDYKKSAFNRATMAKKRQPGSTFKPFIYQTALDMGYSTVSPIIDVSRTFSYISNGKRKIWNPKNYERNYKGFLPLKEALIHSRNNATINLICDLGEDDGCSLGVKRITKRLKKLDIDNIPKDLSLALGNLSLSPLKIVQMYTMFSNHGHVIEPRLVSKIVSRKNAILYETKPKEILEFTTPAQSFLMTSILKDVIKRGTGRNARVEGIELAGKTGTTNDYVDAWFCGYSPSTTTVVWFGRDNSRPIGKGATGGAVAAPVFQKFYESLLRLYPKVPRKFTKPEGVYEKFFNGKVEYYTKYSPLPETVATDIMELQRPKLHPINSIANSQTHKPVVFSKREKEPKEAGESMVIESEPDPTLAKNSPPPATKTRTKAQETKERVDEILVPKEQQKENKRVEENILIKDDAPNHEENFLSSEDETPEERTTPTISSSESSGDVEAVEYDDTATTSGDETLY